MSLQSRGPITIPDLLGRRIEDERDLSLTVSPAHVISQDAAGVSHHAVVLGTALGRRALMDLLFVLAPYKAHGPDRFARVLDNWGLHDRALTSDTSERLLMEHARSLKFTWDAFTRHRSVFMEVLRDATEDRRIVPVMAWSTSEQGKRQWLSELPEGEMRGRAGDLAGGRYQTDCLVGLLTVPYFLPELRRKWRAWQPLVKDGKSNYVGPASVPVVALMHRRAILNSAFVSCAEEYASGTHTPPRGS